MNNRSGNLKLLLNPYTLLVLMALFLIALSKAALAEVGVVVPDVGFDEAVIGLYDAYKLGGAAAILFAVIQLLKQPIIGGLLNKAKGGLQYFIVTLLGVAYGIVQAAETVSTAEAIIQGLLVSGGAMMIYQAYKYIKSLAD